MNSLTISYTKIFKNTNYAPNFGFLEVKYQFKSRPSWSAYIGYFACTNINVDKIGYFFTFYPTKAINYLNNFNKTFIIFTIFSFLTYKKDSKKI